ncbi:MAG: preprotein translocase subunit SecG [Maricaulaceae bacterium]
MSTVLLIVHLLICVALIGSVMLQRSEGGALGMGGGGGGGGGLLSGRGAATALTRATSLLGAAFFITSISLSLLAGAGAQQRSVFDRVDEPAPEADAPTEDPFPGLDLSGLGEETPDADASLSAPTGED